MHDFKIHLYNSLESLDQISMSTNTLNIIGHLLCWRPTLIRVRPSRPGTSLIRLARRCEIYLLILAGRECFKLGLRRLKERGILLSWCPLLRMDPSHPRQTLYGALLSQNIIFLEPVFNPNSVSRWPFRSDRVIVTRTRYSRYSR